MSIEWLDDLHDADSRSVLERTQIDWHLLESVKLLHDSFKPRNPGSRILPASFHAVSNSSPSFSDHPFPKGSVQSTVTCTYVWNSLPFVPSTFCAEDALQQPSHWFYKCCLEIQAEPLLSQMVGSLVLQVILFFLIPISGSLCMALQSGARRMSGDSLPYPHLERNKQLSLEGTSATTNK